MLSELINHLVLVVSFGVTLSLKKNNFGLLPVFERQYLSYFINFLWWIEGQLIHPKELHGIPILLWRNYRKPSPKSLLPIQSFFNSFNSYLFIDVVRHHTDNTKVSKTDTILAYLEFMVWWERSNKSDYHTTVLFQQP